MLRRDISLKEAWDKAQEAYDKFIHDDSVPREVFVYTYLMGYVGLIPWLKVVQNE